MSGGWVGGWKIPGWRRLAVCDSGQQERGSFFALRPEFAALMQWFKSNEREQTANREHTGSWTSGEH